MEEILQRMFKIIEKTGERCIFMDPSAKKFYVLMEFNEYENLLNNGTVDFRDLTEEQILDKLGKDISAWKQNHIHNEGLEKNNQSLLNSSGEIPSMNLN